jgi:hypothetical protein
VSISVTYDIHFGVIFINSNVHISSNFQIGTPLSYIYAIRTLSIISSQISKSIWQCINWEIQAYHLKEKEEKKEDILLFNKEK